ncbi:hypothetical protein LEP1GSC111_1130 [Leptospira interrogans str. UT126]|nr:hypothetical protein LEP1GSC007_4140 [Leptospira interrogans serovar Bulgarica str. Mallika]EMJ51744.1 hypothetical protein LEP1GSC111_1130 [Leptospira interrogans str. UT126]
MLYRSKRAAFGESIFMILLYSEDLICFSYSETGLAAIVNKLKD